MQQAWRTLAKAAAPALLALCTVPAAQAGLIACEPVPGSFTVFLSEPEFTQAAFKSRDDMRDFMKRLTKQLDDGLDRRWARSPNPNPDVRFVNCVGRAPSAGGESRNQPQRPARHNASSQPRS